MEAAIGLVIGQRDRLLGGSHRQALRDDPARQLLLRLRSGLERQQGASMPGRQHAGGHSPLYRDGEFEQSDHVGDQGPRAADARRQFIVGDPEFVEQLLVCRRFF